VGRSHNCSGLAVAFGERVVVKLRMAAIAALFLLAALPSFAPAAGEETATRADARLGYDTYAVLDLISTPSVLFGADSQRFIDSTFAEIEARADSATQARFRALRELLRPSAQPFDPADAGRSYRAATAALATSLGPERFSTYTLGSFVATVAFNARVLREEATDVDFRRSIGTAYARDGDLPGVAEARAKLASDAPDAWDAIASDADALATALLGEAPPNLQPAPEKVWALLVRGRPIVADGPRKGTSHASLEIVYGDGRHRSLGAYPDGKNDFTATGGKLVCAFDLETGGPSRAYPLVAPRNVSYEAIAERFGNACRTFDKRRPAFRYVPQDDKHSNDNAFVYGLLRAESLDMPQSL